MNKDFEDIVVPIYYNLTREKIIIDEDSIRDEFEEQLKKVLEEVEKNK